MQNSKEKFVIFLMGPTASGKTKLAIEISNYINSYLISVDSAMVYKHMNIGTAKPDKKTLQKYPHAMIDICEPQELFSVNKFIDLTNKHTEKAIAENKIPLLVGGTSFYFNALENGLSDLPESTAKSKEYFQNKLKKFGSKALHEELEVVDPITARKIHYNDSQRIIRALEVYELSGKKLSTLQGNKKKIFNYPIKKIIINPNREELHKVIANRFDKMLALGLIDEVKNLRKNKQLNLNMPSIRCVGYRQVWQYLDKSISKEEMIERAVIATRQLCKHQFTWLRNEKDALKVTPTEIEKTINFILG